MHISQLNIFQEFPPTRSTSKWVYDLTLLTLHFMHLKAQLNPPASITVTHSTLQNAASLEYRPHFKISYHTLKDERLKQFTYLLLTLSML